MVGGEECWRMRLCRAYLMISPGGFRCVENRQKMEAWYKGGRLWLMAEDVLGLLDDLLSRLSLWEMDEKQLYKYKFILEDRRISLRVNGIEGV